MNDSNLNSIPGKEMNSVGMEPELKPDYVASTFNIKVTHGDNEHQVTVPSNSSFGDLKSVIAQKLGLNPEIHKLLFRGKEKEDDDDLQTTGVKDNSKVLIVEDTAHSQKIPEEILKEVKNPEPVKETSVISRGGLAVSEVRKEVDMLSEQVSALQAVVDGGTQVDDKDIVYLTEMLMRQLLKLDGIDAEGEGRVQRKMEVRRIQSLVETMDILKSRNSNPSNKVNNAASLTTTQWETFEPGNESVTAVPSQMPTSTSTPEASGNPTPLEFPSQSTVPSIPAPAPAPAPTPAPAQFSSPTPSTAKVTQEWEQFD